ncbi:DNA cytosine methyltransferase [Pelagibacterium lentulum]|nr:DNA cytosine methyltransferase [Pelagibacterium lentulum]
MGAKAGGIGLAKECAPTLGTNSDGHSALIHSAVRRLTPVECERLQGFPDNYTQIPWRGKPADQCPDGPRYKALGNSWAVPKFTWLRCRIARFMPAVVATEQKDAASH